MANFRKEEFMNMLRQLDKEDFVIEEPPFTLLVVGGFWMAMRDLRESTHDIDSVITIPDELAKAVARVAVNHEGLATDWINDSSKPVAPNIELSDDDMDIVYETDSLRIALPPARYMFAMKAGAERSSLVDEADAVKLWRLCNFKDVFEAKEFVQDACSLSSRSEEEWDIEIDILYEKHLNAINVNKITAIRIPQTAPTPPKVLCGKLTVRKTACIKDRHSCPDHRSN